MSDSQSRHTDTRHERTVLWEIERWAKLWTIHQLTAEFSLGKSKHVDKVFELYLSQSGIRILCNYFFYLIVFFIELKEAIRFRVIFGSTDNHSTLSKLNLTFYQKLTF